MKLIKELKCKHPGCEYDEDLDSVVLYVDDEPVTLLENASADIDDYYEGYQVESSESDPRLRTTERISGAEAVRYELGGYAEAFRLI